MPQSLPHKGSLGDEHPLLWLGISVNNGKARPPVGTTVKLPSNPFPSVVSGSIPASRPAGVTDPTCLLRSVSLYNSLVCRLKGLGRLLAVCDNHVAVVLLWGVVRPVPTPHDDYGSVNHAELVMLQGGHELDLDENSDRLELGVKVVLASRLFLVEADPDIVSSLLCSDQIVGEPQIRDPIKRAVNGLACPLKLGVDGIINLVVGREQRLYLAGPGGRNRQNEPEGENECFHVTNRCCCTTLTN